MVTKPQIYNASEHSVCNLKKGSQEARIVLRPWGDRLKSVYMFHHAVH